MVDTGQETGCASNISGVDRAEAARLISQAVAELFFSAENQSKFHGTADELGLTPPMLKSLIELEAGEAVPMRHLADRWGCDASFVTVTVDGLERQGFVRREVAPHDRRIKTVELTELGEQAREQAVEGVYGPRAGFEALSRTEQVTLAKLLTKMAQAQADLASARASALADLASSTGRRAWALISSRTRTSSSRRWRSSSRWASRTWRQPPPWSWAWPRNSRVRWAAARRALARTSGRSSSISS